METADDNLSFDLDLPHLRVAGCWTPTVGERGVCRDIVRQVTHRVPSRDADARARIATMAKFFYDAMDVIRAAPPGALPTLPGGMLPTSSLTVLLMNATRAVDYYLQNAMMNWVTDDDSRRWADEIEPEVVEFRRAIGIAGGGDARFWTPAGPGEGPVWSVRSREETSTVMVVPKPSDPPEPAPSTPPSTPPRRRRWFRWWNRGADASAPGSQ